MLIAGSDKHNYGHYLHDIVPLIDLGDGLEIPSSWLPEGVTVEQVATGLWPLLDLPVEIVLPTHGKPADRAALERALT